MGYILKILSSSFECCAATNWWLRSPNAANSTNFCNVNNNGNANNNNANNSNGVAFGSSLDRHSRKRKQSKTERRRI